MENKTTIKLFEQKQVRSIWNEEEEKWYFFIVDVVGVLSDSSNPNNYWKVLKHRLAKEGSQLVTDCNQLKLQSFRNEALTMTAIQTLKEIFCNGSKQVPLCQTSTSFLR